MPISLTTPIVETTNTIRIESFTVYNINGASPEIIVNYSRGQLSGPDYTVQANGSATLSVAGVAAKAAEVITGETLYAAIKTALYDLLLGEGHVEPGTVS